MNVWVHTCAVIDVGASQIVIYRNGERAISQSHVGRVADIAREFNFLGKSEDRTAFVGRQTGYRTCGSMTGSRSPTSRWAGWWRAAMRW